MNRLLLSAIACILLGPTAGRADDFGSFRGPNGLGVLGDQDIPNAWSISENMAWKASIPGAGWSQPVIVGDRIFVTAAVAEDDLRPKNFSDGVKTPQSMGVTLFAKAPDVPVEWKVFCLSARDGSMLWQQVVHSGKPKFPVHPSNTYATESPVADSTGVYVSFGAAGIVAGLSLDGKQRWKQDVGVFKTSNSFGTGSSLAIHDGKTYVQNFTEENADIVCFDNITGAVVWKKQREEISTSWSTPVIWENEQRVELIISGSELVESFDPATGDLLWKVSNVKAATACSPGADRQHLYFGGSDPFSKGPLFAVAAGSRGDLSPQKKNALFEGCVWLNDRAGPGMPSPVSSGRFLYVVEKNILRCYDANTGTQFYQNRLPQMTMVAASPLIIGEKLLLIDEQGHGCLVAVGPEFQIVGAGEIDDTFWATPAVADDAVYFRGINALYCVKKTDL